jgi:hypothetical protein
MKTVAVFPYTVALDAVLGLTSESGMDVTLFYRERRAQVNVFLDSGADISIFPYTVGVQLGFESLDGHLLEYSGVGGGRFGLAIRQVGLRIGTSRVVPIRVGWSPRDDFPMLIGRLDVFNHFTFEFNHAKQEIRVKQ